MKSLTNLFLSQLLWLQVKAYEPTIDEPGVNPGPKCTATQGEVWPQPLSREDGDGYLVYTPKDFAVDVNTNYCDYLDKAIRRASENINKMYALIDPTPHTRRQDSDDEKPKGNDTTPILMVYIHLGDDCNKEEYAFPLSNMTEDYDLIVEEHNISVSSRTVWGIIRGLETLTQLFYVELDDDPPEVRIDKVTIRDEPLYPHRGIMLDTARHFISVGKIMILIDAMACNKMNVLHWHLVDDESFPFFSTELPMMSMHGSYAYNLMYSVDDVKNIVTYAAERGIRVIPELDVPGLTIELGTHLDLTSFVAGVNNQGHTGSWGISNRQLLTQCFVDGIFKGFGPLKVIDEKVYKVIQKLFKSITDAFPDEYLHIGGDDVFLQCWATNPQIRAYMQKKKMEGPGELLDYFFKRLFKILPSNKTLVLWQDLKNVSLKNVFNMQDVVEDGVNFDAVNASIVLQIKDSHALNTSCFERFEKVIISSCWDVEEAKYSRGWEGFYNCEALAQNSTSTLTKNMVGGEALLVTKLIDDHNIISRAWPLISATAERLWTAAEHIDEQNLPHSRLEEHVCRMLRRGIDAEPPNGHGFCLTTPFKHDSNFPKPSDND